MVVYCVYSLYVSFVSLFYAGPSLKSPVGLCCIDTWSVECLGFLQDSSSHFPGLCRLVLTGSPDSLFLRYPAIDIVWRGPVSLAFGFLIPLLSAGLLGGLHVLVGAVSSPSPGCQFCPSWLWHMPYQFTILLLWYRLWHQTPMGSLLLSCVCVPSASTPLLLHIHHPGQWLKSC